MTIYYEAMEMYAAIFFIGAAFLVGLFIGFLAGRFL